MVDKKIIFPPAIDLRICFAHVAYQLERKHHAISDH